MTQSRPKVFVSFTRRDRGGASHKIAQRLTRFLSERGVEATLDELSFKKGRGLLEEMEEAVAGCDRFLFIATPAALGSEYVRTELRMARARAVRLRDDGFIQILNMEASGSLEYLPLDLRSLVSHQIGSGNVDKVFYELLLELLGMSLADRVRTQRDVHPESKWLILERYQILDVFNMDGDTRIRRREVLLNISDRPENESHVHNLWADRNTELERPVVVVEV